MDRRDFLRSGFRRLRSSAQRRSPELVAGQLPRSVLDLSVLTAAPSDAERLVPELLGAHFLPKLIRLRASALRGAFPGGIALFDDNRLRDYRDDVGLLAAALRQLEDDLRLREPQENPALLRYTSAPPPFSRSVGIYHRDRLLLTLPLQENGDWEVDGDLGRVAIRIRNGSFLFFSSPCRHGICTATPPIIAPGQRITCLPGRLAAVVGTVLG
jgi:hypothetical protein